MSRPSSIICSSALLTALLLGLGACSTTGSEPEADAGGTIDDDTTASILKASLDAGINFVDLADVYMRGESEKAAGKALEGVPRHELVISSSGR